VAVLILEEGMVIDLAYRVFPLRQTEEDLRFWSDFPTDVEPEEDDEADS